MSLAGRISRSSGGADDDCMTRLVFWGTKKQFLCDFGVSRCPVPASRDLWSLGLFLSVAVLFTARSQDSLQAVTKREEWNSIHLSMEKE